MLRRVLARLISVMALLPFVANAAEFDPKPALERTLVTRQRALEELQAFCDQHIPPIPSFDKSEDWQIYADQVRRRTLDTVVFRGEAAPWREAATKVEWLETIDGGEGYKIKKVRYEAFPGTWIPALLYEPTKLDGKMPVFLNVNGHDRAGKAALYKQTRCINHAKRGILSLNVEWYGMGQLRSDGFAHARINQLDLCGTSGVAVHFLAMKRGIDLLLAHPNADPQRVGVAGLSGGGWQTIFISALDPRVTLCNPVAGYSSFKTRSHFFTDLGDSEQTPVDLGATADYALLTAMLAPRAALLTFNAADQCCFQAGHALPPLLDAARPAYRLFNKENDLRWHVNHIPGNHNFEQENREAQYRVIGDTFYPGSTTFVRSEIACEKELKKAEELEVKLPEVNADFSMIAKKLAESLPRDADMPSDPLGLAAWQSTARQRLSEVIRPQTYRVEGQADSHETIEGVDVTQWRLHVGDTWTLPAAEFTPRNPRGTVIIVSETGRASVGDEVRRQLSRQQRVIAVDPLYWGECKPPSHDWLWMLMIATVGDRPLGVQASQLAAIARWSQVTHASGPVTLVGVGPKASLAVLAAGGLETKAIGKVETIGSLPTLKQVLTDNLTVNAHPEYFCFGLLEQFDIPQLAALVGPGRLVSRAK